MKRLYANSRLLILLLASLLTATADVEEPRKLIRSLSDQVLAALQTQESEFQGDPEKLFVMVEQIILPRVDLPRLSSLTIGKHWRTTTAEQQQAFSDAFKHLVIRTLMQRPGAQPMKINYRLHLTERGWLAYDISIKGISLATSYRNCFTKITRQ
jgi:phospholipid transport system substrate-binding protein